MASDLVLHEGELSIAANKVERYFDFLESCFSEYNAIVSSIPGGGLEDAKIVLQLISLQQIVALEKVIFYAQRNDVEKAVDKQLSGIEEADRFVYPDMSFQDIISILTGFL